MSGRVVHGSHVRARLAFVALALATIALGLVVHRGFPALPALAAAPRDVLGDALWGTMLAWWAGALFPAMSPWRRGALAWAGCVAVETSQLLRTPVLDALRETTLGGLVLGHDFDARDLAAYAAGVALAVLLESLARR